MEIIVVLGTLFALGLIGTVLFQIARRAAYVVFMILIGAVAWYYIGGTYFPGRSVTDVAVELNKEFADAAMGNIEEGNADASEKIANAVVQDIDESIDAAKQKEGIEAWKTDGNSEEHFRGIFQRFMQALREVFQ